MVLLLFFPYRNIQIEEHKGLIMEKEKKIIQNTERLDFGEITVAQALHNFKILTAILARH